MCASPTRTFGWFLFTFPRTNICLEADSPQSSTGWRPWRRRRRSTCRARAARAAAARVRRARRARRRRRTRCGRCAPSCGSAPPRGSSPPSLRLLFCRWIGIINEMVRRLYCHKVFILASNWTFSLNKYASKRRTHRGSTGNVPACGILKMFKLQCIMSHRNYLLQHSLGTIRVWGPTTKNDPPVITVHHPTTAAQLRMLLFASFCPLAIVKVNATHTHADHLRCKNARMLHGLLQQLVERKKSERALTAASTRTPSVWRC